MLTALLIVALCFVGLIIYIAVTLSNGGIQTESPFNLESVDPREEAPTFADTQAPVTHAKPADYVPSEHASTNPIISAVKQLVAPAAKKAPKVHHASQPIIELIPGCSRTVKKVTHSGQKLSFRVVKRDKNHITEIQRRGHRHAPKIRVCVPVNQEAFRTMAMAA